MIRPTDEATKIFQTAKETLLTIDTNKSAAPLFVKDQISKIAKMLDDLVTIYGRGEKEN